MSTTTTNLGLNIPAYGETPWHSLYEYNWGHLDSVIGQSVNTTSTPQFSKLALGKAHSGGDPSLELLTNSQFGIGLLLQTTSTYAALISFGNSGTTPSGYRVSAGSINNNFAVFTASSPNFWVCDNKTIKLEPFTSGTPSNPQKGQIYFNDSTQHFYGYTSSGWKQLDN